METQSSFDLNVAIQSWRENLAQSASFQNENLKELESHLRDSIAHWQTKGLSEQEAFTIAAQRMGGGRRLENEFSKVNRNAIWLERLLWMLVGVQVWVLINGVAGMMTENLLLLGGGTLGFNRGMALPISASTFVRSLLVVGAAWLCWWFMTRNSETRAQWIEKKLQRRSSFVMYSVAALLLLIAAQMLFFVFQWYWLRHVSPEIYGRSAVYLSYSQILTHLVEIIVMIILILALARRRSSARHAVV